MFLCNSQTSAPPLDTIFQMTAPPLNTIFQMNAPFERKEWRSFEVGALSSKGAFSSKYDTLFYCLKISFLNIFLNVLKIHYK